MRLLLVNTNRMQPPIAPVGLDYLAAALQRDGHEVDLLDLCFDSGRGEDPIQRQFRRREYDLLGVSIRNTDDCYYPGRAWFGEELRTCVERLRRSSPAPILLGGVGFSVMPEALLRAIPADGGIVGDGEFALAELARGVATVPGLIRRDRGGVPAAWPAAIDLAWLPAMRRDFVDNVRYYRAGGQIGFETKRGCAARCVYCPEPLAKGQFVRVRPPVAVVDELECLMTRDIAHFHTCDSEFNRPLEHALALCQEIVNRGLGERLRWYAYCAPTPFPDDLAAAMRRAGCAGIDFGADSADPRLLRRLGRDFGPEDIRAAVARCRQHGIVSMVDLLLGGPGETAQSVRNTLDFVRAVAPDRVGLSIGVRIYPHTALARLVRREPGALCGPGAAAGDFAAPTFYLSPALGEGIFALVASIVGGDPRFYFSDPTAADRNYNYSGNDVLIQALQRGYRGAYWDILRRLREGLGP